MLRPALHAQTADPTALPLLTEADLRYLGAFNVPAGSDDPSDALAYGGSPIGMSPGGLWYGGHNQFNRLCEITIPAMGGTSTLLQRCVDVTEGKPVGQDVVLGGALTWNGRLIVSSFVFYDADYGNQAQTSHYASGLHLATTGDAIGPVKVGDATIQAGYVGGYMGGIPPEWRDALGGPAFTGQSNSSIISRTSTGPAFFAFDPDDIGRVAPVPAVPLMHFPLGATGFDAPDDQPIDPPFAGSLGIAGAVFIPGTRTVLYFGRQGLGKEEYCTPQQTDPNGDCYDPVSPYKGYHSYPYRHVILAFDAVDFVRVRKGEIAPWQVKPYASWRPTEINDDGRAGMAFGGMTFDPATNRIYLVRGMIDDSTAGARPQIVAFQVTPPAASAPAPTPTPPPPPPPRCAAMAWTMTATAWSTRGARSRRRRRRRSIRHRPSPPRTAR